jgi:FAD binding domain/Berberine and berberine like
MARVHESDVRTFADAFNGRVITDRDQDYDGARSIWNGAIDRRPEVIARCASPEDVAAAIGFARGQGLEISVRGGGHAFSGSALCDGGLTIDLGAMKRIAVDPAARRATVGGGASWAELDAATQAHGLAAPGGTISHTGVGGLTLGGGFGWLTPRHGLSIDNLASAQVVTAAGDVVRASPGENPDLFWAIRGGGGNFGVVTSFEYDLHEVGPVVQLGLFFWDVERGGEALRFGRDLVRSLPDDMGTMTVGMSAPPAPFVPEQHHFTPGFALVVVGWGTPEEHERAIRPIRDSMPPLFELVTPIPYANLQQMLDESAPWGILAYEKALYLDDLSDAVIDAFTDFLPRRSSPMTICPVFRMGGAFARVGDDDTAFGGRRSAGYAFNMSAVAPTPELLEADRAWVRSFWEALSPHATGAGSYVNFMSEYDEDRVRTTYGPAKYDRLARLKAEYDPHNVFHLNPNIKPAA